MLFEHNLVKYKEVKTSTTKEHRIYHTPDGDFPSVTTVLNSENSKFIDEWKNNVGEEYANRVSQIALQKGEKIHTLIEQYLKNKNVDLSKEMPHIQFEASNIFKKLKKHVNKIRALEIPLWSTKFKIAGRVDCIAEFDNKLCIIDFKTSKRIKKREEIDNYILQATCYACMFYEQFGIDIKHICIIMITESGKILTFHEKIKKEYIIQIKKLRDRYYDINKL
jgi:genome maintenance exonuclease 1